MGHVCEVCGQMLATADALDVHFRAAHYEEDSVACPFCDFAGVSVNEMQTHVEFVHPDPSAGGKAADATRTTSTSQPLVPADAHKKPRCPADSVAAECRAGGSGGKAIARGTAVVPAGRPSSTVAGLERQRQAAIFDVDVDDGSTCTVGAVDQVRAWLTQCGCTIVRAAAASSHEAVSSSSSSSTVWLCTAGDHYAAGKMDAGWGCGYRNTQMLVSALAHGIAYANVLFEAHLVVPSITKIQKFIERAWKDGFDPDGARQMGGHVVATRKWIGASDIWAFFTSRQIKCHLVDFHRPSGPGGTHPMLLDWVKAYFQKKQEFTAPIYLQHQGHSRTIVGYEMTAQGEGQLLLFDPSNRARKDAQPLTAAAALVKRCSLHELKSSQYQMLAVVGVLSEEERNRSKIIWSTRVP